MVLAYQVKLGFGLFSDYTSMYKCLGDRRYLYLSEASFRLVVLFSWRYLSLVVFLKASVFIAWENFKENYPLLSTLETVKVGLTSSKLPDFSVLLGSIEYWNPLAVTQYRISASFVVQEAVVSKRELVSFTEREMLYEIAVLLAVSA